MPKLIATSSVSLSFVFGVAGGGPLPRAAISLFGLLLAMVAIWCLLVSRLFNRLRDRHHSTYVAMGSPSLLWNNSLRNQWLFLKFLLASRWRDLDDPVIARIIPILRVWLVVYPIVFVVLGAVLFFA